MSLAPIIEHVTDFVKNLSYNCSLIQQCPFWFCSVAMLCLTLCNSKNPRLPYSLSAGACSDSCLFRQWCHPTVSSSATPFSSRPPSIFPSITVFSNESSLSNEASGGQSTGASALASVLPVNCCCCWFPLGLTDLISLLSKGLSRVFPSTTVQKHQFLGPQSSLWSKSLIYRWLLEKYNFDYINLCQQKDVFYF